MSLIRADLSQYYPAKALFEQVLGRTAFMRVKDYGPLSAWRENYIKLLRAIDVAAEATVEIVDAEWKQEVSELLAHGCERLQHAQSIDELHAVAAATLGELAFLQLGLVPRGHRNTDNISTRAFPEVKQHFPLTTCMHQSPYFGNQRIEASPLLGESDEEKNKVRTG
jgi:hypothetical protein